MFKKYYALFLCSLSIAYGAAPVVPPPSPSQPLINMTLYPDGTALVTKKLSFDLKPGKQTFLYENAPKTIKLQSVLATFDSPDPSSLLLSQSFLEESQSLMFEVMSSFEQLKLLTLQYLLSDILWNVCYTAQLSPDQKHMNLNGWIEILNKSGTTFNNAQVLLNSGTKGPLTGSALNNDDGFQWLLPRLINLPDGKKHYISYITAYNIPLEQEYRVYINENLLDDLKGSLQNLPIERVLEFKNTDVNGLGLPFAAGKVTMYHLSTQGIAELLPSSDIQEAGIGDMIPLHIPSKLDQQMVSCVFEQTDFKKLSATSSEAGYRLQITNRTNDQHFPIKLILKSPTSQKTITRTSHHSEEPFPHSIMWNLEIPAKETIEIRFRLRLEGLPQR